MKHLVTIALTLILNLINAQPHHPSDTLYTFTRSGLNLREQPNAKSNVVAKLKYGEAALVIEPTSEYEEIDQRAGWWLKVKSGNKQGYLFSGFLSRIEPPLPPKDSFEFNYHFRDWLETYTKNDSLVHEGYRTIVGKDPYGKDTYGNNWKLFSSGTFIMNHGGYEWYDFSIESMDITLNDLMNYLDFIKSFRSKKSEEGKISYTYNLNDYPRSFKVNNFYNTVVTLQGNTIKVFIHMFDL